MKLELLFVCLCVYSLALLAQPDGWKMVDRFYGFRYEIFGKVTDQATLESIQAKATSLGCFGWVQVGKESNIVGEARCSKANGKTFQDWLETVPGATKFERLVYSDTKIRLHFSHFKILDQERDTCFLDKPHKCPDISTTSNWNVDKNGEGSRASA